MQNSHIKPERFYGLDFLRVLLSVCVVTIHILHYGGFRSHADLSNSGFYFLWLWGIIIDCTVNCFAVMSGYVLYSHKLKYTGILRLYLIVIYHGLFITLLFWLFFPGTVNAANWKQAFFPISQEEFWYFTSYFGVFFLIPVVTNGMRSLSKQQAHMLVFSLIVIFSVVPTFTDSDPFDLNRGYSVLWVLVMFIIGTCLNKCHDTFRFKSSVFVYTFTGCILVTCLGMLVSVIYPSINGMILIEYTSPTIVLAAIAVVLLFSSMEISPRIQKFAVFCAPFTFSIYLLHEHPLVRQYLISDRFVPVLSLPVAFQILSVFAITLVIWLICFSLDYVRKCIFSLMKVDEILQRIEENLIIRSKDSFHE